MIKGELRELKIRVDGVKKRLDDFNSRLDTIS